MTITGAFWGELDTEPWPGLKQFLGFHRNAVLLQQIASSHVPYPGCLGS
jgi:hypothetical protein